MISKAIRVFTLALISSVIGCDAPAENADLDTSRPTEFGYQVSPRTVNLIEGRRAYERYCVGCHGEEGDGVGKAARFLNPAPRNFKKGEFKFMSTRFGELPTDDDLYRTITHGLRGSSMPAWGHLPELTRRALIAYIKTFSKAWQLPPTSAIPFVTDPYAGDVDKSAAIARGEVAYHGFFACWNCHPAYVDEARINEHLVAMGGSPKSRFRPDLHQTAIKSDSQDKTIFAPDFLRDFVKSGTSAGDLYRVIAAGISGTAMPTWIDAAAYAPKDADGNALASQADIWAIAYYVRDLIKRRPAKFAANDVNVRGNRAMKFGAESMEFVAKVESEGAEALEEEEFLDEEEFEDDE